jgi:hypothetical protein
MAKRLIEAISNGLGSQSMEMVLLAIRGEIPASVSITADTGSEKDRLWSNGERTTAREYFERVVVPLCAKGGIDARFVRAVDRTKQPLPELLEHTKQAIAAGKMNSVKLPLFGSEGGRLRQVCTEKWKVRAINQEARRLGATSLITAQGIHLDEAVRRVKGRFIGTIPRYGAVYQDTSRRNKAEVDVKWCRHYYPLVDRKLRREDTIAALIAEGIPYLISSECDMCPHQDLARWQRHTPQVLIQIAAVEANMGGKFFFTDERIPLLQALEKKAQRVNTKEAELDFGCENSYCGI